MPDPAEAPVLPASGVPSWVMLATPDGAASAAFYSALFGWGGPDSDDGMAVFRLAGTPVAAMFELPEAALRQGAAARWLVHVTVRGIGSALEHVAPAGGTVLASAFDVPGGARMAMVADPTGAELGIWQPPGGEGDTRPSGPGALTWTELYTRSKAQAAGFYEQVFGWELQDVQAGEAAYMVATLAGMPVAGVMPIGAGAGDMPSHWMPYFAVADTDASTAQAAALGAEVCAAPEDLPAGRMAVLRDPQGALFFIVAERADAN